jgi:hypothetical protein
MARPPKRKQDNPSRGKSRAWKKAQRADFRLLPPVEFTPHTLRIEDTPPKPSAPKPISPVAKLMREHNVPEFQPAEAKKLLHERGQMGILDLAQKHRVTVPALVEYLRQAEQVRPHGR